MATTRLALSMDQDVVARARRLAKVRNTSISRLFVSFVCLMDLLFPFSRYANVVSFERF